MVLVSATSATLAALGALHVAWGLRVEIPGIDGDAVVDAVVGSDTMPSPAACFTVAGLLGAAAVLVAGRPARHPFIRRAGQLGVAATLGARSALGFTGNTDIVAPAPTSDRFRELDRRYYSPLCAALALGALLAAGR